MFRVGAVAPSQKAVLCTTAKVATPLQDSIAIIEADMLHFAFWPARPCGRAEHP